MRTKITLTALGLASVLAGCTTSSSGQPAPVSTTTSATPTPSVPLPAPPRELRVDGIQACDLLTTEQRQQLGFAVDSAVPFTDPYFKSPACTFGDHVHHLTGAVMAMQTHGIEDWSNGTLKSDSSATTVGGFPALIAKIPNLATSCDVVVSVAKGQVLDGSYSEDGAKPVLPQDELCAGAQRVAEAALTTLQARK